MRHTIFIAALLLSGIFLHAQDEDMEYPNIPIEGSTIASSRYRQTITKTIIQTNNNTNSLLILESNDDSIWVYIIADTVQTKHIKIDPTVENILFFSLSKMKQGVGNPPADGVEQGFATLDFDKTTDEETFSTFFGPLNWAVGSSARIHLGFFVDVAPAIADTVVWGVEFTSIDSDGIFDFSNTTTALDSVQITAGTPANNKKVHNAILVIPSGDLIEGGILMLRVYRDADNGADGHNADARLVDFHIHYTRDKI